MLEANGAIVPPDDDPRHTPRASLHARLATEFLRPVDAIEPIYVRAPDAERWGGLIVRLRRLEVGDLDAIERIERASYPTPWSRSMFATELRSRARCRSAPSTTRTGSSATSSSRGYVDAWHVMNVAVAPESRRQGVATALLRRLLDDTRHDAQRGYTLEVRVSNVGAIALYEGFGFRTKGVRRGYYTDNRRTR